MIQVLMGAKIKRVGNNVAFYPLFAQTIFKECIEY